MYKLTDITFFSIILIPTYIQYDHAVENRLRAHFPPIQLIFRILWNSSVYSRYIYISTFFYDPNYILCIYVNCIREHGPFCLNVWVYTRQILITMVVHYMAFLSFILVNGYIIYIWKICTIKLLLLNWLLIFSAFSNKNQFQSSICSSRFLNFINLCNNIFYTRVLGAQMLLLTYIKKEAISSVFLKKYLR